MAGRGHRDARRGDRTFTLSPNHHRRIDRLSELWGKPVSATVRAVLAVGLATCESRGIAAPDIIELLGRLGTMTALGRATWHYWYADRLLDLWPVCCHAPGMLVSATRLRALEEQQARRREINRAMVQAGQGPAGRARRAYAAASAQVRAGLVLPPLPVEIPALEALLPDEEPRRQARDLLTEEHRRALDLITRGASKRQAAGVMGLSFHQVDALLRHGYRALDVHGAVEAAAAWRARAEETGHKPDQGDLAALERLREQAGVNHMANSLARAALTKRQREILELARQGVRRRDLPAALGVSASTVKALLNDCFRRLGVRTLQEAVARAAP